MQYQHWSYKYNQQTHFGNTMFFLGGGCQRNKLKSMEIFLYPYTL